MKIFKYPIVPRDEFTIEMPQGAQPLSVDTQGGQPQLWCLVDPGAPMELRRFFVRGTGHDAAGMQNHRFLGTFQLQGGALVFHCFVEEVP